jgi:hypothetical protein
LLVAGFFSTIATWASEDALPRWGFSHTGDPPIVLRSAAFARDQIAHYRASVDAARRVGKRPRCSSTPTTLPQPERSRRKMFSSRLCAAFARFSARLRHCHHGGIGTTGRRCAPASRTRHAADGRQPTMARGWRGWRRAHR